MMKTKRSSGFTLLEIMIATGLMGGLSLVLLNLSTEQIRIEQRAVMTGLMASYRNELSKQLGDSQSCMNTLGGRGIQLDPVTTPPLSPPFPIPVVRDKNNDETFFKAGINLKPDNAFTITSMNLKFHTPSTPIVGDEYWSNSIFIMNLNLNSDGIPGYKGNRQKKIKTPLVLRVKKIGSVYTLLNCSSNKGVRPFLTTEEVCRFFESEYEPIEERCLLAPYGSTPLCTTTGSCVSGWTAPSTDPATPASYSVMVSIEALRNYAVDEITRLTKEYPFRCELATTNRLRYVPDTSVQDGGRFERCVVIAGNSYGWVPRSDTQLTAPQSVLAHSCVTAMAKVEDLNPPNLVIYPSGTFCPTGYDLIMQMGHYYHGSISELGSGDLTVNMSAYGILSKKSESPLLSSRIQRITHPSLVTMRRQALGTTSSPPTTTIGPNPFQGSFHGGQTVRSTGFYGSYRYLYNIPLLCCRL